MSLDCTKQQGLLLFNSRYGVDCGIVAHDSLCSVAEDLPDVQP